MFAVGANSGSLTLYELRQNKCTTINAHSLAITAAAFSPDGKYLVSYACSENKLCFWQTSTGIYNCDMYPFNIKYIKLARLFHFQLNAVEQFIHMLNFNVPAHHD